MSVFLGNMREKSMSFFDRNDALINRQNDIDVEFGHAIG